MQRRQNIMRILVALLSVTWAIILVGCNSDGAPSSLTGDGVRSSSVDDSNDTVPEEDIADDNPSASSGLITGTATKGPVRGATVKAYAVTRNGSRGGLLGSGRTDDHGGFSVSVDDYSGALMLEMTGGRYTDEATGFDMEMLPGNKMTAAVPFIESGQEWTGVQISPLTSMAREMAANMVDGMTEENILNSNTAIGEYFDVNDVLYTQPMNPSIIGGASGNDRSMLNYGITMGAMSQYAYMQEMMNSSDFIQSLMEDASDGRMDGMRGQLRIMMQGKRMMSDEAGAVGLAEAMVEFIRSPMNRSGVSISDMQNLIDKLVDSDGKIGKTLISEGLIDDEINP